MHPELTVLQLPYRSRSAVNGSHSIRNILLVHAACVPCLALALGADTRPTEPPPSVRWTPSEAKQVLLDVQTEIELEQRIQRHQPFVPQPAEPTPTEVPFSAPKDRDSTFWRGIAGRRRNRRAA